jgi:DNA-binding transcriptional LysR family regulator
MEKTDPHLVEHPLELLRSIDGLVIPHGFLSDIPSTDLYDDTWVCVIGADNPAVGDELTLEQLADSEWVVMWDLPTAFAPAARQLSMMGVEARVSVAVDSFLALPFLVAGTDRVAVLQSRLAERLEATARIRALPCPWEVVPLKEAFWWHPSLRADPAHRWLRSVMREVGGALGHQRD